jgi:hypothetical protein
VAAIASASGSPNGEATLERDLFSIPSFGPPQELSLSYSSLEPSTAGRFGAGWVSNLSQYLTFESGFVVWHRADGGRVPRHGARSLEKEMKSRILFLIVPVEPFIDRQNKDIPAKHTVG